MLILTLFLLAALIATLGWARRRWTVATVRGSSMTPTLRNGDQVIARRSRVIRRNDLIVFAVPTDGPSAQNPPWRVKRVAGVAGDPVPAWLSQVSGATDRERVPPGHLIVSGDNQHSQDSRELGYIDLRMVRGVVIRIIHRRRLEFL